jgi:hypothetical protein
MEYSFENPETQAKFEQLCIEADKCKPFLRGEIMYDFKKFPLGAQSNFQKLQRNNPHWMTPADMDQLKKVNRMAKELEPEFWKEKERREIIQAAIDKKNSDEFAQNIWDKRREDPNYFRNQGD